METQIKSLARNWYVELIVGLLFIAVAVWVFLTPASSYVALSVFFAITFLLTGIMKTTYSFMSRNELEGWGWSFAGGIFETLIGILLVSNPLLTMAVLPYYVGFALLFRSSLAIGMSFELGRLKTPDWGWMLFFGILGLVLSFIMIFDPTIAGLTIVAYTGLAFLAAGIFEIILSIRLKKLNSEVSYKTVTA